MDSYVLYLPYEFPSESAIKEPLPYNGILLGYPVTIIHNSPYYAFLVENIESADSAEILFGRLSRALHLMALELSTAIRLDKKIQLTEYLDDPIIAARNMNEQGFLVGEILDALIDGAQPAIYLKGKVVRRLTGQRASFGLGYAPNNILDICERSLSASSPSGALSARIALATEIHAYAKFETSGPARFVMLCSVLEVLAPSSPITSFSEKTSLALRTFEDSIISEMTSSEEDSYELNVLRGLRARLVNLKQDSHTGRIKAYLEDALSSENRDDFRKTKKLF